MSWSRPRILSVAALSLAPILVIPLWTGHAGTLLDRIYLVLGDRIGIGTASPHGKLEVSSSGTFHSVNSTVYSSGPVWHSPHHQFRRARGTEAAPEAVAPGDILGEIKFTGYKGAAGFKEHSISILGIADGAPSDNLLPGRLVIETSDGADQHERLRIDAAGDVGIGTTSGDGRLSVRTTGTEDVLNLYDAEGDNVLTVLENGNVGIGVTDPKQRLAVDGMIGAGNLLGGLVELSADATGNIIRAPSDGRLKAGIAGIGQALDKILALRAVSFEWKDKERFGSRRQIGFIAQEVDRVLPEAVGKHGEYWSVNTNSILAVGVEAIQDLSHEMQRRAARIEFFENRIRLLEERIRMLEESSLQSTRAELDPVQETESLPVQ